MDNHKIPTYKMTNDSNTTDDSDLDSILLSAEDNFDLCGEGIAAHIVQTTIKRGLDFHGINADHSGQSWDDPTLVSITTSELGVTGIERPDSITLGGQLGFRVSVVESYLDPEYAYNSGMPNEGLDEEYEVEFSGELTGRMNPSDISAFDLVYKNSLDWRIELTAKKT